MENEVVVLKIKRYAGLAGFDMDKIQRKELNRVPFFVIPKRFERLTHALEGRCSIQLSYGTDLYIGISGRMPHFRVQR